MSEGSFTFPALPKPKPLPPQNPLLAKATVIDRSRGSDATHSGSSAAMGAGQSIPADGPAASTAVPLAAQPQDQPPRKKVPYEKGYSQMDWVRLTRGPEDLSGRGGAAPRSDITLEELAQHNTPEDGWTALRGKVYNLGPYMKFHPGGEKILKLALGKDCTALFNRNHAWVNGDALLAKCLVGTLAQP